MDFIGWRRRAQLYDQLVDSLPKNYRKLIAQFAKSGAKSSSSSESSSTEESGGVNDPGLSVNIKNMIWLCYRNGSRRSK
jgi:hypothetical protein